MRRIIKVYREVLGILYTESPFVVVVTFVSAILTGAAVPLLVWVSSQIFNLGLAIASGETPFSDYTPYLVMYVILTMLPAVVGDLFIGSFAAPRCQLILRTAYKGKMLQKLKKLRYEHLESESSMEILDKAYTRAEETAWTLFPYNVKYVITSLLASAGTLYLLVSVRWWLLLTTLLPFILEAWLAQKFNVNIYSEMETYWKRERSYSLLGNILRSRDYVKENRLFGASNYLIGTYRERLNARNREYERFYLRHLKRNLTKQYITKIAQVVNALILLWLYIGGNLSIGMLISLSTALFTSLYSFNGLEGIAYVIKTSGFHLNTYQYYDRYFSLSEDEYGSDEVMPNDLTIEFIDVHFTYPGTEKKILNGLSFKIGHGEKVSLVGKNGEGKTTMIKLLLGLFQPDSGEIRVGGKPLASYSQAVRSRLFGPVFQDFIRYSVTLGENIGIGDISKVNDNAAIGAAMKKAKVDAFAGRLAEGTNTLLGRDFEGGVDLSGGQWQRIAIARAFMGDKPILILDEPTSQLDPMAESQIYSEFAEMSEGKTSVFITHRLGSTMITDRIFVISGGRVTQSGSHDQLMAQGGLYADMFNSQKQWYSKSGEEVEAHG